MWRGTSVKIVGTGSYLPERVVTSLELAKRIRVEEGWIRSRTGILERRFAHGRETNADMAVAAAQKALKSANLQAQELDCIFLATLSPDRFFPGVGPDLQARLRCNKIPAIDIRCQCNGFVFGLSLAVSSILSGQYRKVLLVASELQSRYLKFTHKNKDLCVLFGDGAGAVVLEACDPAENPHPSFELHTDGHFANDLSWVPMRNMKSFTSSQPFMNKTSVIVHSSRSLADVVESLLAKNHLALQQVDFIIPHQSNKNLLEEMARRLDFPLTRVVINIEKTGNTSSASIPIALDQAIQSNRVNRGDSLLFVSFGSGFSWGAGLLRY